MSNLPRIFEEIFRLHGFPVGTRPKADERLAADILAAQDIVAETKALTREVFPDREEPERFDEFTGPYPDESGASAGFGGAA